VGTTLGTYEVRSSYLEPGTPVQTLHNLAWYRYSVRACMCYVEVPIYLDPWGAQSSITTFHNMLRMLVVPRSQAGEVR
jgi:hypothetical protein